MEWNEFWESTNSLLRQLSWKNNKGFNDKLGLKLDSYFFIFDCIDTGIIDVSEDIYQVLGYHPEEFNLELFFSSIHPDDKEVFMIHEQQALNFCLKLPIAQQKHYKIAHDFRIRKKSGEYIRILQQTAAYELNEVCVLKTVIQHTNITAIKTSDKADLHFIDQEGKSSIYQVAPETNVENLLAIKLTKREIEILELLDHAYSSEQIAEKLFISIHTVRTHRKNLLHKTGCDSTIEMLKMVKSNKLI